MKHSVTENVTVYPVGLWRAWVSLRRRYPRGAWFQVRYTWRYVVRQTRRREWRAVKNTFNGYLAETPEGLCGSGWTRRRALRDLARKETRHRQRQGVAR